MAKNDPSIEATKHYYRGLVFESVGEIDLAIEEYKKAIEYGADYADVHNTLGKALAKKGFLNEARIEFETALRLNPKYLEARKNLNELITKINLLQQKFQESKKEKILTNTEKFYVPENISVSNEQPKLELKEAITTQTTILEKYKISKTILKYFLILSSILIIITLLSLGYKSIFNLQQQTQMVLPTQQESISAITKFKDKLALSCWVSQEILFYKKIQNKINITNIIKFDKDNIVPTSICFIGKNLFVLDGWNKKIYKFIITKTKPILVKSIDLSKINPLGISNYKNLILLLDSKERQIILYDIQLKKIDSVNIGVKKDIVGISSYKDKVWLLDKEGTFYELKNYSEIMSLYKSDFVSGKIISSFLIDEKYLWLSEEGSKELYLFPKKDILKQNL
ncbi:MAG: tetratricopeptide repeat protein [Endomicrobiia bacterium]